MEDENKAFVGYEATKSDRKVGHQLEDEVRNSNPEQLSQTVDGMIEKHYTLSNVENHWEVPGEGLLKQNDASVESFHGGVDAIEESSCVGLELPQHSVGDVVGNVNEEIMKSAPVGGESHSFEGLGLHVEENEVVQEKIKESGCVGLELPQHSVGDVVGNVNEENMKSAPVGGGSHSLEGLGLHVEENEVVQEKTEESGCVGLELPQHSVGDVVGNVNEENMKSAPIGGGSHSYEGLGLHVEENEVVQEKTEESDCVGLELPQHSVGDVRNVIEEIMKSAPVGGESHSLEGLGLHDEENEVVLEKIEESGCVCLELPQHSMGDVGNFNEEIMKSAPVDVDENETIQEKTSPINEGMPNMEHSCLALDDEDEEELRLKPDQEKVSCIKNSGLPFECEEEDKMNPTPYNEEHSIPEEESGFPIHDEVEEELIPVHEDARMFSTMDSVLLNEGDTTNTNSDHKSEKELVMQLADNEQNASVKPRGKRGNSNTKSTRTLRSTSRKLRPRSREKPKNVVTGTSRKLRPRSQEKPKNVVTVVKVTKKSNDLQKTVKERTKKANNIPVNEFTKTRTQLRYLINRMGYEQNLIDAYAGEGWKGQSIEKVKLEKEVQRAKTEIGRTKLKIRDLFKVLDSSIEVGKLPESLFDSEGEIDSEDILCAKCGSKELLLDNDIILCDGACDRAFHQLCLDPPLLNEDIPQDDKGWLCPGCDCKVDCIDSLNSLQGTNLSVLDSWEKVFPEVVAFGKKLDDISDYPYPSDDSEDNDYRPDDMDDVDAEIGGEDESDFYSTSDGIRSSPDKMQEILNQSSDDDSEDVNYNPDASDPDPQINSESSSSDFSSDSEDLVGILEDNKHEVEPASISSDHTRSNRKGSLNRELKFLLEGSNLGKVDTSLSSGRRQVERLDYKKLQADTYGNVSSDSSDEDWMDADKGNDPPKRKKSDNAKRDSQSAGGKAANSSPRRKKINTTNRDSQSASKTANASPKRKKINITKTDSSSTSKRTSAKNNTSVKKDLPSTSRRTSARKAANSGGLKPEVDKSAHTPKKETPSRKKVNIESSPNLSEQASSAKKSGNRRLGETVTQGLLKLFNKNQYPERTTKENAAKELGITVHQLNKWFMNARWSFRHGPKMETVAAETAREKTPKKAGNSKGRPTDVTTTPSRNRKRKAETQQVQAFELSEKKGRSRRRIV